MLSVESQQRIEKLLLSNDIIKKPDLEKARLDAIAQNKPLLTYLAERQLVGDEELTKVSAQASSVPYVNLVGVVVPKDTLDALPKPSAETYMAAPFGQLQGRLAVAMLDPTNVQAIDFLSRKSGRQIASFMASRASIEHVLS